VSSSGESAAKKLTWEIETRKSVELVGRIELVPLTDKLPGPLPFRIVEEHFIEAAGKRYCDIHHLNVDQIVGHETHYGDGSRCADVSYQENELDRQHHVIIKREYYKEPMGDRMERPVPLLFLHVGREPLHKALPKSKYLGTDKILGHQCEVFLFAGVRWSYPQDHVYYLDSATSIPLKVESFKNQAALDKKRPLWTWTAESLDRVQNHVLPLTSKMVSYGEDGQPDFQWNYRVLSAVFDKNHPDSTFWPAMEPGVFVVDSIRSKSYEVPGAEKMASIAKKEVESTAQPIQALPPSNWLTTASWMSLLLGGLIMIVGGTLWWRRR